MFVRECHYMCVCHPCAVLRQAERRKANMRQREILGRSHVELCRMKAEAFHIVNATSGRVAVRGH